MGRIINYKSVNNVVFIEFENKRKVNIEIIDGAIIRVYEPYDNSDFSFAISEKVLGNISHKINKIHNGIKILTASLTIKVTDEGQVNFYDLYDELICKEYVGKRVNKAKEDLSILALEGHDANEQDNNHNISILKYINEDDVFYGLGDKTGFLNKKAYYYEMWNTDDPKPHVDNYKSLYKSIPFIICHGNHKPYGIFFDNTYKTFFDIGKENESCLAMEADEGPYNYYFFAGDTIKDVLKLYTNLTGRCPLPQLWTLGYHQSRWSYENKDELIALANNFRKYEIPCDTIHLDIDYMDGYRVFTYDDVKFENMPKLIDSLSKDGFKIVTIIDPGVKVDPEYKIYKVGVENNRFATTTDGDIYVNVVWPGDSVYPTFTNEDTRKWWAHNTKYMVELGVQGIWNDMNEPASFRGPLPDDIVFRGDHKTYLHKEIHNVYGHLMAKATYDGLKKYTNKRPFVITRACYAGSQKYTTAWTGDNHSIWAHLQMAIPQLCNLGLSGMPFVGTDVGGFGSDCTSELLIRWVQVGCFSPLFRNHAAKGTRRQEPWTFDQQCLDIYRKYVGLRYALLPYIYDLFVEHQNNGAPIMRPLMYNFENDKNTWELNDQFMLGSKIMVAPIVEQGKRKRMVYLPAGKWVNYWKRSEVYEGNQYIIVDAPLDTCPIFVLENSIIPNYPLAQYTRIPETLILDVFGDCVYEHYVDDGESFEYQKGKFAKYMIKVRKGTLTIKVSYNGLIHLPYKTAVIRYKGKDYRVALDKDEVTITL